MKTYISIIILLLSNELLAEPVVNTEYNFYQIYPSSKLDLGKEMNRRSPNRENGGVFQGYTHWYVNSQFAMQQTDGSCYINQVNVSLDVTFTVPQIPKSHVVNEATRLSFTSFYDALMQHENNHMRSGLYAARALESVLLNSESFKTCEQLQESVNLKWQKIIKKHNLRDKEYDKKTQHGRLEGVDIKNFI